MRPALLSGVLAALARSDGPRLAAVLLGAARGAIGDAATAVSAGWTHSCGIYRMFFCPQGGRGVGVGFSNLGRSVLGCFARGLAEFYN